MPETIEALSPQQMEAIEAVQAQQDTPPGGLLGKDQFLQLLVAQMSNQDPLDPTDSRESIAQLAQFSALEQMQQLNEQVKKMRQANGLLDSLLLQGMTVEARLSKGGSVEGIVEGLTWNKGELLLQLDSNIVPFSDIASLSLINGTENDGNAEGENEQGAEEFEQAEENPLFTG